MRIIILFLFLFCACKQEFKSSAIEAQYDKVMVIHDEVMPEISTINRIKRKIKKTGLKDSLTMSLLTQLSTSEDAMMDWMSEFDLDHDLPKDDQLEYLNQEQVKISNVSDLMKNAIKTGNAYLEKKTDDK